MANVKTKNIDHRPGCPADDGSRVEEYESTAPGGGSVQVTRCQECGSHFVGNRRVEEV